jgi:hypothetical protein
MFSEDHAQLIIKQLQSPPKIFSDDDLPLHVSNLLISLANFCTFKFDSQYSGSPSLRVALPRPQMTHYVSILQPK